MIKKLSVIVLLGCAAVTSAYADIAIIVNPGNTEKLDQTQIRNIFLGKIKAFPDGSQISTFDLPPEDDVRAGFVKNVLRKSEANLNAYWARMLFSSKGRPPKEAASSAEVVKMVASNKSAIGYVSADAVDSSVHVLMVIQ